jgi:hypothetical protein
MPMRIGAPLAQIASGLIVKCGAQNAYGTVRHSTLWLKPVLLGQFEFVEMDSGPVICDTPVRES